MSAIVQASALVKGFGSGARAVRAVDAVDLAIDAGDFAVLAGPSGCGKTTLLNLLGGLERPDAGSVSVAGVRLERLAPRALARLRLERIGFIFQAANLIPVLTAIENAEFTLQVRGIPRAERRSRLGVLFERLGISGLEARFPGEMSGGEQQRVAVARALAGEPAIVLADEPTANLDSGAAAALLDLLAALNRERGATLLVASHDPAVIARAGRAFTMRDGRIAPGVSATAPAPPPGHAA
jgi:putative ABC transport system ATP-binding protein